MGKKRTVKLENMKPVKQISQTPIPITLLPQLPLPAFPSHAFLYPSQISAPLPPPPLFPLQTPSSNPLKTPLLIIKNTIRILQYRIDNLNLPPRVLDPHPRRPGPHERGAEDDGQVVRVHPVGVRVVHDAVEVQRQGAERRVVGVREGVDDEVEGVAADGGVVLFWWVLLGNGTWEGD